MRKGGCRGKKHGHPAHGDKSAAVHEEKEHGHHRHHHEHGEGKTGHGYEHKWRWFKWAAIIVRLVLACLVIAAITITIGLFFTLVVSSIIHIIISGWMYFRGRSCCRRQNAAPVDEEEQGLMSKEDESEAYAVVNEYSDQLPVYVEAPEKQ